MENMTQIYLKPCPYTGMNMLDDNIIRTRSIAVTNIGSILSTQFPYDKNTKQVHNVLDREIWLGVAVTTVAMFFALWALFRGFQKGLDRLWQYWLVLLR